ncbi:hypothetical protein Btru_010278 [Bulinus truncatus]|nr:hypothetical protein Btru_010278 [Bulinus truncatus]
MFVCKVNVILEEASGYVTLDWTVTVHVGNIGTASHTTRDIKRTRSCMWEDILLTSMFEFHPVIRCNDWCEFHPVIRCNDWCEFHSVIRCNDWCEFHPVIRCNDWCEFHSVIRCNDWCEFHSVIRCNDWCEFHPVIRCNDWCEFHPVIRCNDWCEFHPVIRCNDWCLSHYTKVIENVEDSVVFDETQLSHWATNTISTDTVISLGNKYHLDRHSYLTGQQIPSRQTQLSHWATNTISTDTVISLGNKYHLDRHSYLTGQQIPSRQTQLSHWATNTISTDTVISLGNKYHLDRHSYLTGQQIPSRQTQLSHWATNTISTDTVISLGNKYHLDRHSYLTGQQIPSRQTQLSHWATNTISTDTVISLGIKYHLDRHSYLTGQHIPSRQTQLFPTDKHFVIWQHFRQINETLQRMFEWPVARPIEAEEVIDIQIYNFNKYLSNRLVGTFRMILQELIEVGCVKISDCLLDTNNVVMKTTVTFELSYNAPDGSVGPWQKGGFEKLKSRELRRGLNQEERMNELNKLDESTGGCDTDKESDSVTLSPSLSIKGSMISLASKSSTSKSPKSPGSKTLGSVVKLTMMKRSKQTVSDPEEDRITLTDQPDPVYNLISPIDSSDLDVKAAEVASMLARTNRNMDQDETSTVELPIPLAVQGKRGRSSLMSDDVMMKAQDFQVCITILEARQLAGLNMDPVVCVQVGDQKKFTSVKESTNCPYYNEYFVFDFHMPPLMLFDKIITLSVSV